MDLGPYSPGKWGAWDLLHELLHELPQSHCGDNGNGTLFLGVHICYSNFVCIGLKHSICHELQCIYIHIYIYIYIYIYITFAVLLHWSFLCSRFIIQIIIFSYISVFLEKELYRKWNERFGYKSQVHFLV